VLQNQETNTPPYVGRAITDYRHAKSCVLGHISGNVTVLKQVKTETRELGNETDITNTFCCSRICIRPYVLPLVTNSGIPTVFYWQMRRPVEN